MRGFLLGRQVDWILKLYNIFSFSARMKFIVLNIFDAMLIIFDNVYARRNMPNFMGV